LIGKSKLGPNKKKTIIDNEIRVGISIISILYGRRDPAKSGCMVAL
jgi:hypothetical protein